MSFRRATKGQIHGGTKIVFDNQKELVLDSKCFGELLDFWKKYKRTDNSRVIEIKSESYPLTCGLCMRTILPDRRQDVDRRVSKYDSFIPERRIWDRRKIGVGIKR